MRRGNFSRNHGNQKKLLPTDTRLKKTTPLKSAAGFRYPLKNNRWGWGAKRCGKDGYGKRV